MQIDTRFLTVHPATAVWWQQRDKCESCVHFNLQEGREGESIMRCRAALVFRHPLRPERGVYCIDVRDEDGPCGPDARMYERRV